MVDDSLSVFATGATISFGAASANVSIPNDSSGSLPKYVRLAATQACYVKIGGTSVTAAAGDLLIQPADSAIIATGNQAKIAAIQVASGGVLQISPVEGR